MKKKWLYVAVWGLVFAGLFVGLISSILDLRGYIQDFFNVNSIIEEKLSPDGEYKAVRFFRNLGSTTETTYHLSIIPADDKLENEVGNVYGAETDFVFEWSDGDALVIKNSPGDSAFKAEYSYNGIDVLYE